MRKRMTNPAILAGLLVLGGMAAIGPSPAGAQMAMSSGGRSLGGYGAGTISSYYGNGGGYMPTGGRGGGVLPLGGGPGVMGTPPAPRMIPQTAIGGASMVAATPIGGISATGGMSMGARRGSGMGTGMGARSRPGRRAYAPLLPGGGMGTGLMTGTSGMGIGRGRAPAGPGFGYPFRSPLEFGGGGGGSGMGMP